MSWRLLTGSLLLALAACGGGEDSNANRHSSADLGLMTPAAASRFLHQATFGATEQDIADVQQVGYRTWVEEQFAVPLNPNGYLNHLVARGDNGGNGNHFIEAFWKHAVSADDQLRQRVAFALSQIFVISFNEPEVARFPRGVASYYDTLVRHSFGNFRDLLEDVSLHPMMGLYLTHLRNRKEDPASGRLPDENYAREVMQLFTIGLNQLNLDGTPRRVNGQPVPTYSSEDVSELAKVFTGWSWAGPDLDEARFNGQRNPAASATRSMQSYAHHHSTSPKRFLGVNVPAQNRPEPEVSLRLAMNTLFNHPNVGPFICHQLIQRLVTSNPRPGHVERCARAFNGQGGTPRGDMKAVIRAILLDSDARLPSASNTDGKLREPVLRMANFLRAFEARSQSGNFTGIGNTSNPENSLGQTPMHSNSVFNFFRPGYVPPNSELAARNLNAPEMQLVHEVSVAGYLNFMHTRLTIDNNRDVRHGYGRELALASDPAALVDRLNLLLTGGQLGAQSRTLVVEAVSSRAVPAPTRNSSGAITNQSTIDNALRDRVYIAVLLTMAAPEYLAQK
ncbi:DUF1800 domain-containing protein [Hydrogenophaga sp.]|uniref:DUF1800 domain-containing protein n=1 Tax=Hydrogenophaga sp. TaxID=1904254 RepID=UPI002C8EA6A6|nr:DUF1800 domain-containing protein [Hydrogenophaga sp.]HMP08980.1 DUF1800 domain-containing protein [Hydrogenophaga sp.]